MHHTPNDRGTGFRWIRLSTVDSGGVLSKGFGSCQRVDTVTVVNPSLLGKTPGRTRDILYLDAGTESKRSTAVVDGT